MSEPAPHTSNDIRDARSVALALITAEHHQVSGVLVPILSDWLDRDMRSCAATIRLADQLTYWAALLFHLSCRAQGTDPTITELVVPFADTIGAAERADVLALVAAAVTRHPDQSAAILARQLRPGRPGADSAQFLSLLIELGASLLLTAAANHPDGDPSALLAHLGLSSALH